MAGVTWTGQVNFTDSSDVATTGVATLTLTPDGGWSNLPPLAAGTPGLPPTLRNVTVTQVAYGTTPPASSWSLVTAGGAGTASVYDLVLYVNSGAAGTAGAFSVSSGIDIVGTPTDNYILVFDTADSKWHWMPQLAGGLYAATSFTAYTGNAATATICTLTVPAQPFDWYPDVAGWATMNGTANTNVELACRLNNAVSGNQIGYGPGTPGALTNNLFLVRAFGTPLAGGFGKVTAGNSATFYFMARQTAATTDAWSVSSAAGFSVRTMPIAP